MSRLLYALTLSSCLVLASPAVAGVGPDKAKVMQALVTHDRNLKQFDAVVQLRTTVAGAVGAADVNEKSSLHVKAAGNEYLVVKEVDQVAKVRSKTVTERHLIQNYFDGTHYLTVDQIPSTPKYAGLGSIGNGANVRSPLEFGRALYSERLGSVLARATDFKLLSSDDKVVQASFDYELGSVTKHVTVDLDKKHDLFPIKFKVETNAGSVTKTENILAENLMNVNGIWVPTRGVREVYLSSTPGKPFATEQWDFSKIKCNVPLGPLKPIPNVGAQLVDRDRGDIVTVGANGALLYRNTDRIWAIVFIGVAAAMVLLGARRLICGPAQR